MGEKKTTNYIENRRQNYYRIENEHRETIEGRRKRKKFKNNNYINSIIYCSSSAIE